MQRRSQLAGGTWGRALSRLRDVRVVGYARRVPPKQPGSRVCFECGKEIGEQEKYLVVTGSDGDKQVLHTSCFTMTTFDPERFANVEDPESDA